METEILNVLEKEYLSTNEIKKRAKTNWYRADYLLHKLFDKGLIDKLEIGKMIVWKLK